MEAPSLDREIDVVVTLARRLLERGRPEDAADLLALALRLAPRHAAARGALAEVEESRRRSVAGGRPPRSPRDALREQLRRDAIDAAQFLGLAHLYAEKGLLAQSLESLEVAKAKDLAGPEHHKLAGRVLSRRRHHDDAAGELERSLRLNPFDRDTAEALGQVEFDRQRYAEALVATVHAFLLLQEGDEERNERLKRRIRTLKRLLGHDTAALAKVFHERQEHLQTCYDRLEWRREQYLAEEGLIRTSFSVAAEPRQEAGGRIALATRLRQLKVWTHFSDEQIFRLTRAVSEESYDRGAAVFPHSSGGRDLFLVESGEVTIQRKTSYGTFTLAVLGPGELFGESSFITGHERSGDAQAGAPAQLFRLEAGPLERLIEGHPDLGVQLYWSFWHGLTRKLRATNAQLQSFFDPGALPENFLRLRRAPQLVPATGRLDSSDKIRLFREQGLSRRELMTLAAFSEERRFPEGAYVFHEGDRGGEIYVIADGRAVISKFLAGAGEEALAILGRGDFFGEMSLIDGEPRSADARAHGGPLTVLALDREAVQEVLSMDSAAALEFLQLLCRLLANRLREIDEKVIGWRILAGEQPESASA
jgi:CRP-like cAMP-binding protein